MSTWTCAGHFLPFVWPPLPSTWPPAIPASLCRNDPDCHRTVLAQFLQKRWACFVFKHGFLHFQEILSWRSRLLHRCSCATSSSCGCRKLFGDSVVETHPPCLGPHPKAQGQSPKRGPKNATAMFAQRAALIGESLLPRMHKRSPSNPHGCSRESHGLVKPWTQLPPWNPENPQACLSGICDLLQKSPNSKQTGADRTATAMASCVASDDEVALLAPSC